MKLRLAFVIGSLLLALGGGLAAASSTLDPVAIERSLVPSEAPGFLGPISFEGRTGWACEPERSATSKRVPEAHLPATAPDN